MFRRKPPQLSVLEELQQTHRDVSNTTIKNLTLEENGHLEDALKGWKLLHTLMLYKLDLFEKKPGKIRQDEALIMAELKGIRDENVKHLVRLQLRIDEQNRRANKPPLVVASNSSSHSMSVPSLRNSNPASRSLTGNGNRQMIKSLRLGPVPTISTYKMSALDQNAVKVAANHSWAKPKPKADQLFDDFDQTEMSNSNWERLNLATSTSTSDSLGSTSSNLIDLSDDLNFFEEPLAKSVEDLSLKKRVPPPPPKSRIHKESYKQDSLAPEQLNNARSVESLRPDIRLVSDSNRLSRQSLPEAFPKPQLKYGLKSSADVRSDTKKYAYTQPTPINVKKMMQTSKVQAKPVAKTAAKPPAKAASKSTAPKPTKPVAKAGNFPTANPIAKIIKPANAGAPKPKPGTRPAGKPPLAKGEAKRPTAKIIEAETNTEIPNSPTMDDLLEGYNDDPNGDMGPEEMDALIKSIRGIDELSAVQILNDIVVRGDEVYWDDIVGLETAKNSLKEAVVYPFLRPDLFRGLREPTRGMLLFGPPGTGKTMLARAVATESKSTFFSISSSSLTSKYLGESEKLVKALFLLARKLSPLIVFIDEIDSLLGTRTEGEVESMRRIKNEFLVQWSELSSAAAGRDSKDDVSRVLILGATNLPWGIDDAARRRFAKRVYIPLPEDQARRLQVSKLLTYQKHTLLEDDFDKLIELTEGFSGSDITLLAKDSAMGPLRSLGDKLLSTPTEDIRPIQLEDFVESLKYIRPSVSSEGLGEYETWSGKFGSSGA